MTAQHKETLQKMLKQFVDSHNDERAEALGTVMFDNIIFSKAIGNMLQEFEGTFDVEFDADKRRVLFDDENGKRHLIYFNSGTVIVEEK